MTASPLRVVFTALLLVPTAAAWPVTAKVVGIIDGDTVTVLSHGRKMTRCRLFGIDAPEKGQAFGQASKNALSRAIYGKTLDVQVTDVDRYGRSVCRLTMEGVDVGRWQVTLGMAWVYRRYNKESTYIDAELAAKQASIGLWSVPSPIPPWAYRMSAKSR